MSGSLRNSEYHAHMMCDSVISQGHPRRSSRWRRRLCHTVKGPAADTPTDAARIFDCDFVARGTVTISNFETLPRPRNTWIEVKHVSLDSKSENPLKTGAVQPSGRTRVPGPS